MLSPIQCFRSDAGTSYVYDRGSNEIIRVQEPLYSALRVLHASPSHAGSRDEAPEAVRQEYERARAQGLFAELPEPTMASVRCEHCWNDVIKALNTVTLCITERCNLRCTYCSYSGLYPRERSHSPRVMPLDIAKAAVRYLLATSEADGPPSVSFYGGECMLHFGLLREVVDYTKSISGERKVQFHFDTNGTLLRPDHVQLFLENDAFVQVSIDGPRHLHDRFRVTRNGRATFDRVIKSLELIRDANEEYYRSHVRFSVTIGPPYNLQEIDDFFGGELFAGHVVSAQFVASYDTEFFDRYETEEDRRHYRMEMVQLRHRFVEALVNGDRPSALARSFLERPIFKVHKRVRGAEGGRLPCNGCCVPGCRKLFADVEGNYRPCERVGGAFILGNVYDGLDVAKMQQLVEQYRAMSEPDCRGCWAARMCSECFASARAGTSLDLQRKRLSCDVQRSSLRNALSTYVSALERNPNAFDYVKDVIFV